MSNEIIYPIKTGEVNYIDELGNLCLAESFQDEDGEVFSTSKVLQIAGEEYNGATENRVY